MSQTTQQNAASSEELAATSEEMSSQAEQLQSTMAFFKLAGGTAPVRRQPKPATAKRGSRAAPRPSGAALAGEIALAGAELPDEAHFSRF
jgi:methyl-accepting chemotaxis protein